MTASGSTAARPKPRSLRWESERARRDRWIALGTIAAVAIALFWPIVVGLLTGEPRFFEWDVPEQYWPDLVYLCDALHEGELPLWNPYDRLGYPYLADPQSGAYHPLNWSLCAVGGSSPHWGFAVFRVVFGFVLCGGFGLMWLRRLEFPWSSSVAGAAMLMCAPFMRHNWELNLTSALAWLPLMLWAAEGLVRRRRIWDGALLAFAFGLCAWTGSPPALWHASTFTLLYTVARLWPGLRAFRQLRTRPIDPSVTQKERARTFDLVRASMVALVLAIGFVAPVFVPGLELAEHSVQAGRSFESIADKALSFDDLIALLWPKPGNHLFVGWLVFALTPLALRERELGSRFAVGVAQPLLLDGPPSRFSSFQLVTDHTSAATSQSAASISAAFSAAGIATPDTRICAVWDFFSGACW